MKAHRFVLVLVAAMLAISLGSCGGSQLDDAAIDSGDEESVVVSETGDLETDNTTGEETPALEMTEDQTEQKPESQTPVVETEDETSEWPEYQISDLDREHLETICFVSWVGEAYHEDPVCIGLNDEHDLIEMTIEEAIDAGYEPCDYCTY